VEFPKNIWENLYLKSLDEKYLKEIKESHPKLRVITN
jgi:hypothetical protein